MICYKCGHGNGGDFIYFPVCDPVCKCECHI